MKKTLYFLLFIMPLLYIQCSSVEQKETEISVPETAVKLPKVLFITTGINFEKEDPDLPQGVVIAIQTFGRKGIPVRLEPRDVLFDYDFLIGYDIIILSTTAGYHDADRKYSLTYMTDAELKNLSEFVNSGGVIIAGDNVGRNYFDGTDRISEFQKLNPQNYPLANAFGVVLKEKNMKNYSIEGEIDSIFTGKLLPPSDEDLWIPVPDSIISKNLKTLAVWKKDTESTPAIIQNKFGKGMAFLLASSDFLHPANNGGYRSIDQIQDFYDYVADEFYKANNISFRLNPWPNAHNTAFCTTFNPEGDVNNYKYVFRRLKKLNIKPTFFVNGQTDNTIKKFLKQKNAFIESTGFYYLNYDNLSYPVALNDILQNENRWDKKFDGFRFPFTTPNFTGLLAIDLHNYTYESSISANNIEFMHGCVFPYNIVISQDKFFKSTDILEIAPTYHDDYFFLNKLIEEEYNSPEQLEKDVMLYEQYLQDFWQYGVKPYNGLMVFLGHPGFVGYNKTTFSALENLITTVKDDNAWITNISNVSIYRKNLEKFRFYVDNQKNKYLIYIETSNNVLLKNVTINIDKKPEKAYAKQGMIVIKEKDHGYGIIFEAFNGQVITIEK